MKKIIILAAILLILGFVFAFWLFTHGPINYGNLEAPFPSIVISSLKESEGILFGIEVTSPYPMETIASPVTVKGKANVFEGHVNIRIKDSNGRVWGQGFGTGCMGDEPCPFSTGVSFTKPKGKTGVVEAYTVSPKDGAEEDLIIIPVRFGEGQ